MSTAVSFEGARPAGSAALPSRSVDEESALSAAEADGELTAPYHAFEAIILDVHAAAAASYGPCGVDPALQVRHLLLLTGPLS